MREVAIVQFVRGVEGGIEAMVVGVMVPALAEEFVAERRYYKEYAGGRLEIAVYPVLEAEEPVA